jgi:hypothetical protein
MSVEMYVALADARGVTDIETAYRAEYDEPRS